jgi:hypothetical protein
MSNFIPDQPKAVENVPFYEDVTSAQGWQGQTTTKSMETLKSEITMAVSRLGGMVNGFQKGIFLVGNQERQGFRVSYSIEIPDGKFMPGRIDIAALPVRKAPINSFNSRCEKSLKMALYMLRNSFDGLWFLQQLSPGFAPLMPFMLSGTKDLTVSQLWSETALMQSLLPPGDADFIEGEVKTV